MIKKKNRKLVAYILKEYKPCLLLYNWLYKLVNKSKYFNEMSIRQHAGIFDYQITVKELPYYPIEINRDSNMFGHAFALKKYCGIQSIGYVLIEHGLQYGSFVANDYYCHSMDYILTLSSHRKRNICIKIKDKPCFAIGPYIHYADSFYEEHELNRIKSKIGKVLLVFLMHSCSEGKSSFNQDEFIEKVKEKAKDYDTVLINVFYDDILSRNYPDNILKIKGLKIVTAGNRYDSNFIRRLKSMIMLSDYTMSNSIGTHIGYCIYLGKPHYLFNQNVTYIQSRTSIDMAYSNPTDYMNMNKEKEEILHAFSQETYHITHEQYEVASKYWGFKDIKSLDELRNILI